MNAVCPRYFEYNGDGLRTEHTMGKFVTDYTWDTAGGLPLLLQETKRELHCVMPPDPCENVPVDVVSERTYVYGLDLISATDAGGVQTYYLYDGLGSTADLADDTGSVLDSYTYDVFGDVRTGSLPSQPDWDAETFLFTGEQYDAKARKVFQGQPGRTQPSRWLSPWPVGWSRDIGGV